MQMFLVRVFLWFFPKPENPKGKFIKADLFGGCV